MTEDAKLNGFFKAALERDAEVSPGQIQEILGEAERVAHRRRLNRLFARWVPVSLVAASLALVACFVSFSHGHDRPVAVVEAIDLLWELEGASGLDSSVVTPGEMLLAWQEEPIDDSENLEM